jgi:hypothetical protein
LQAEGCQAISPREARTITDRQVETVVIKTLESAPRDATHWSTWEPGRQSAALDGTRLRTAAAFT